MYKSTFISAGILLACSGLPAMAQAPADSYLAKPVIMIVPFGPGASTDNETRLYARKLAELTGGTFLVDYKPGAGTTTGTAFVAKASPDGHTLLAFTSGFTSAPALYKQLPYDPIKNFTPVTLMTKRAIVLAAPAAAPFRNITEYIAYTRSHPGEVNLATPGSGSGPHLNLAWLQGLIGTKVTYVHYKGTAPAMVDLLAGRVHMLATTINTALPQIKSGKLRAIAIANAERSPLLPDGQTVIEQGVPGYDYSSPFGFVAPGGTPVAVVNRIHAELVKVSKAADIVKTVEADGGLLIAGSPEQLRQLISREINLYRKLAQDTGVKLE
jgi:tripartite-type tricarboxylate transporter receptor subunit TctC